MTLKLSKKNKNHASETYKFLILFFIPHFIALLVAQLIRSESYSLSGTTEYSLLALNKYPISLVEFTVKQKIKEYINKILFCVLKTKLKRKNNFFATL